MQFIPPQPKKRLQDFVGAFPLIRPIPAHTIQQPHKPPIHRLRHVGWHTVKRRTSSDTRYHRHAGHCTSQRSRPIIIRYIRVQHSADHASPAGSAPTVCGSLASSAPDAPAEGVSVSTCTGSARRRSRYFPSPAACDLAPVSSQGAPGQSGTLHPAGQSSGRGAAGGAEPLTATAVSLFGLSPDSQ